MWRLRMCAADPPALTPRTPARPPHRRSVCSSRYSLRRQILAAAGPSSKRNIAVSRSTCVPAPACLPASPLTRVPCGRCGADCRLCRQLSGAVAQTWVPVRPDGFVWSRSETLQLVRTTGHGQRHMCSRCGGVLSIVYDSQPDCIWPVAGSIDDAAMPSELGAALCRSIHICCAALQPWYALPDDGQPRLKYAG